MFASLSAVIHTAHNIDLDLIESTSAPPFNLSQLTGWDACIYLNVKGKDRQRHLGLVTTLSHATSAAGQLLLEIEFPPDDQRHHTFGLILPHVLQEQVMKRAD